jgi:hypothetical protein
MVRMVGLTVDHLMSLRELTRADTAETDNLSEEDRRKAEKKAKKVEAKARAAAEEAKKLLTKGNQKKDDNEEEIIKDVDQDTNGEKLWQTKTPLQDIEPFVSHLELIGQDNIEALELVCRAAIRRGVQCFPLPSYRVPDFCISQASLPALSRPCAV